MKHSKAPREPNMDDYDKLRERVAERLDGLSILVITNREDAQLGQKLMQEFTVGNHAPERIEIRQAANFQGAMPRVLAAISKRISANAYDVVMAVNSFLPHTVTNVLRAKVRNTGTDLIMISKGRPKAAVQEVARFYKLDGPRTNPTPNDLVKRLMS